MIFWISRAASVRSIRVRVRSSLLVVLSGILIALIELESRPACTDQRAIERTSRTMIVKWPFLISVCK